MAVLFDAHLGMWSLFESWCLLETWGRMNVTVICWYHRNAYICRSCTYLSNL